MGAKDLLLDRLPLEELRKMHDAVGFLARMEAPLIVCAAECLAVIKERQWFHEMGCSSFGDFVWQYCQQTARWGEAQALLGRRLRELPKLRAAIRTGEIGLSVAYQLAGVIDREDEDLWIDATRGLTVRQVAELLRADDQPGDADPDDEDDQQEEDPPRTLERPVTPIQKARFTTARMRLDRVNGKKRMSDELFSMAVCAEVQTTMLDLGCPWVGPGFDEGKHQRALAARRRNRVARRAAEARAEARLPRREPFDPPEIPIPTDLRGVMRLLTDVVAQLAGRDLEIGRLASFVWRDCGLLRLGYASPQQYAREHLGMSLKSVSDRRTLARRTEEMPVIRDALASRRIGYVVACLIGSVATPGTAAEWARLAGERTVKHLAEEVRAADVWETAAPPTREQLDAVVALERAVDGFVDPSSPRQLFAAAGARRCRIRIKTRRSFHDQWTFLERAYEAWGSPYGDFIDFVSDVIWQTWPLDPEMDAEYLDVAQRDGGCTSPVCTDRECACHHIVRRSQGGGEERENLTGAGYVCHIHLIHAMRSLKVSGRAPDHLDWQIGPADIGLRVFGRRLLRRAPV